MAEEEIVRDIHEVPQLEPVPVSELAPQLEPEEDPKEEPKWEEEEVVVPEAEGEEQVTVLLSEAKDIMRDLVHKSQE